MGHEGVAIANQERNRNLARFPQGDPGMILFPHEPVTYRRELVCSMDAIKAATQKDGRIGGFMFLGFVSYKAAFEPTSAPTHQTAFIYLLGVMGGGERGPTTVYPPVFPRGVASEIRLISYMSDTVD